MRVARLEAAKEAAATRLPLDGGADPTLLNAGLGNPLHQAAAWPGEGREAAHKGHAEAVRPNSRACEALEPAEPE